MACADTKKEATVIATDGEIYSNYLLAALDTDDDDEAAEDDFQSFSESSLYTPGLEDEVSYLSEDLDSVGCFEADGEIEDEDLYDDVQETVNSKKSPQKPPAVSVKDQEEIIYDQLEVSAMRYEIAAANKIGDGARPKVQPNLPPRKKAMVRPRLSSEGQMTQLQKKVLLKMWNVITENVRANEVLDYLIQNEIFSLDMQQEVKSQQTWRDQTSKMLEILMTRGGKAYNVFLNAIKQNFDYLYDDFRRMEQILQDDDEHVFNYHEPPMTGAALKNTMSGFMNVFPETRKRRQRRKRDLKNWVKDIENNARESQANTVGRRNGQMLTEWVSGNIKLKMGQYVVILGDDGSSNEVSLLTRLGEMKVPRSFIKDFGDPKKKKVPTATLR